MSLLVFAWIVAVEVGPTPAPAQLERALLAACTAGLGGGEVGSCVEARSWQRGSDAVAMISWKGDERVVIEVGVERSTAARWQSRELRFEPADPPSERWRSAGFTIAMLLREHLPDAASAAPPLAPDANGGPTLRLRALALTGTGLLDGPWRLGGGARAQVRFASGWLVGGAAQLSRASRGDPAMSWLDLSLGGGGWYELLPDAVEARLRLELLVENVAAALARQGVTERVDAWVPGVLGGADLLVQLSPRVSLSAEASGFWLDGATVIRADGEREAVSAGAGLLFGLGAEFRF